MMSDDPEMVEAVVCNMKDLPEKQEFMKEVDVGSSGKCLLILNKNGDLTALGHKCTHYGAPLARGALNNGRIRCPWHGACFSATTGDIEDYPGLDSLPKYQVIVDDESGDVKVRAKLEHLKVGKRNACMDTEIRSDGQQHTEQRIVIIGGGPASIVCVETLRKEGFTGSIIIVCKEPHPPYDRAKLSKAPDAIPQDVYLRGDLKYYDDIKVDLRLNTEALSVDAEQKKVVTRACDENEDRSISFDRLFIATGGTPRTLHPMTGFDCNNIFVLRTVDDANKLASQCKDKRVALVGSSFIAMEIAAFLAKKKESTSLSVICGRRSNVPFQSSLGPDIGGRIMKMHEEKGIKFYTSVGVAELKCNDEKNVTHIRLSDDTVLEVDLVILGIGVTPSTNFLQSSKIELDDKGFIPVDGNMKTNVDSVYAGGDVVTFPLGMKGGERCNVQHWQMAHKHGRIAAYSIIKSCEDSQVGDSHEKDQHVQSIPFFWTVQFGISIRYAGHGGGFDNIIIKGVGKNGKIVKAAEALSSKKFVGFYVKKDHVIAVATMMADPIAARFAEHLKDKGPLKVDQIDSFLKGDTGDEGKGHADKCSIN
uniref:apoptosis-inducing factor 3-like n=1 Tax=Styela clava TaxID=7725 RepID=UPI001939AB94|nr:apoptosis-inducing factor 3-like [Styela clava]